MTEEKVFSVVAETRDGTTQTLSVRGRTPGEVFQQVKEMPGIRRVGRVTEVTRGGDRAGKAVERHRPHAAPGSTAAGSRDLGIGRPMSGPRVVIPARPTGGEQPFKHLQAPPERPREERREREERLPRKAAVTADQGGVPPTAAAQAGATPAPTPGGVAVVPPGGSADAAGGDYRIVKSRRRDGAAYLLQRGRWREEGKEGEKGRRVFTVEWEAGFTTREEAEQQRDAMSRT
jgi:hypothetical protein